MALFNFQQQANPPCLEPADPYPCEKIVIELKPQQKATETDSTEYEKSMKASQRQKQVHLEAVQHRCMDTIGYSSSRLPDVTRFLYPLYKSTDTLARLENNISTSKKQMAYIQDLKRHEYKVLWGKVRVDLKEECADDLFPSEEPFSTPFKSSDSTAQPHGSRQSLI